MGATVAIMMGISTIVGVGGTLYSGMKAQERAEDQAEEIERRTEYEQERLAEEAESLRGRQRAAYAAAGVRVDEDTPLAVVQETERRSRQEIEEIGRRGFYSADIARTEGQDILTGSLWSGAGTLLGGAARTGEMYQRYMR